MNVLGRLQAVAEGSACVGASEDVDYLKIQSESLVQDVVDTVQNPPGEDELPDPTVPPDINDSVRTCYGWECQSFEALDPSTYPGPDDFSLPFEPCHEVSCEMGGPGDPISNETSSGQEESKSPPPKGYNLTLEEGVTVTSWHTHENRSYTEVPISELTLKGQEQFRRAMAQALLDEFDQMTRGWAENANPLREDLRHAFRVQMIESALEFDGPVRVYER